MGDDLDRAIWSSKIRPPCPRPGRLERPRVLALLAGGAQARLVVVSAPAGYGKTTAVAEWLYRSSMDGNRKVAWLALDEEDRSPARFAVCLSAALAAANGMEESPAAHPYNRSPPELVDAALSASVGGSLSLVIDDIQFLEESEAFLLVPRILPALGPDSRLVLVGRRSPALPLGRLRSLGELVEIGPSELRFDADESREFLERECGRRLPDAELRRLLARIEGWPAALGLAALSLRGNSEVGARIDSFRGDSKEVFQLLAEEVFANLEPRLLRALLCASVLREISAPLLAAVAGTPDAEALLDVASRDLGFLSRLGGDGAWCELHPLVRQALARRLALERPGEAARLHRDASAWFESRGLFIQALRHSLEGGDAEASSRLAERRALDALGDWDLPELTRTIAAIPVPERESRPWLLMAEGWSEAYSGRLEAAEAASFLALQARDSGGKPDDRLKGHAEAIAAYAAWIREDGSETVRRADAALGFLGASDARLRRHLLMTRGSGFLLLAKVEEAEGSLRLALSDSPGAALDATYAYASAELGHLLILNGRLDECLALCSSALASLAAAGLDRAAGLVWTRKAYALYLRGDLDEAAASARAAIARAEAWGQADSCLWAALYGAEILADAGDPAGVKDCLSRARGLVAGMPWFAPLFETMSAVADLRRGDLKAASRVLEPGWAGDTERDTDRLLRARMLLERRRYREALTLLDGLRFGGPESAFVIVRPSGLLLRALALEGLGRRDQAIEALGAALSVASPLRLARPFLQAGRALLPLFSALSGEGPRDPFLDRLVLEIERSLEIEAERLPSDSGRLSPREREVLRLFRGGLTVEETAASLFLSAETVRTHAKRIYAKLGVHRRVDALRRAAELGEL